VFDNSYKYRKINVSEISNKSFLKQHLYGFLTQHRRYMAVVEEYNFQVFIVKFFPVSHKLSEKKYHVIFNDYDAPRVIRTCINIMLDILEITPLASFGFIGANTMSDNENEEEENTQRFRIYSKLMVNFFAETAFLHLKEPSISAYLMVNKQNTEYETLTPKIVEMFQEVYPDLIF